MEKYRIPETPEEFTRYLTELHDEQRERRKQTSGSKRKALTQKERAQVLQKTDARCHLCGEPISKTSRWSADHVLPHSSGGRHAVDNFLAACGVCNRYKLDSPPERFQLILKMGVWSLGQIASETKLGNRIALKFIAKEIRRQSRKSAGGTSV